MVKYYNKNQLLESKNLENYKKDFKYIYNRIPDILDKIKKLNIELINSMNHSMDISLQLSENLELFKNLFRKNSLKDFTGKEDINMSLFKKTSDIAYNLSNFMNNTVNNFENTIKPFFENYKLKYDSFNNLFNKKQVYINEIRAAETKLNEIKNKIINKKSNISELRIDNKIKEKYSINRLLKNDDMLLKYSFPNETKIIINMKKLYLIYNNYLLNEYFKFSDLNIFEHKSILRRFSNNEIIEINNLLSNLGNF